MIQMFNSITIDISPLKVAALFYGTFLVAYFFTFRCHLFSLHVCIENKYSKRKIKKQMHTNYKKSKTKSEYFVLWLTLNTKEYQECKRFYPSYFKCCIIYNSVLITIFSVETLMLPFSLFYKMRSFILKVSILFIIIIIIATLIIDVAFRCEYHKE